MDNETWLLEQLSELQDKQTKFADQALLADTKKLVQTLSHRLDALSGELDGRTWNPANW